ncbi:MAG: hypothetical protein N2053_12915, partial [Chitinispirillaceae bacterium]|nr:hypothetical protein [Chitinispirillaceae bacterium]
YMDIGGIHEAISDTLYIDSLPELEYGKEYTLDIFYAERHTIDSRIWITSNIIAAAPKKRLQLIAYPNDTICTGEKVTLVGLIFDENGQRQRSIEDNIRWKVLPLGTNNDSHLSTLTGDSTILSPIGTNQLIGIEGRAVVEDTTITDTVWIYVKNCSTDTTTPNIPPTIPPTIPPDLQKQGPYVKRAIYKIGPLGEMYDTLQILFSEPVRCDSLKKNLDPSFSFKVYDTENRVKTDVLRGTYYIDRDLCLSEYITEVSIIVKPNGIIPKKDSIKLVGIAVDKDGNLPDTTKLGAIDYKAGSGINIIPVTPEKGTHSPMIISKAISLRTGIPEGKEGKVIAITTRGPLVSTVIPATGELTYGKAIIYDPVANVVAADLPIKQFSENERLYYIFWDGTNRQKRKVGSGSYLLRTIVQYKDEPEKRYIEQRKFIIKWK